MVKRLLAGLLLLLIAPVVYAQGISLGMAEYLVNNSIIPAPRLSLDFTAAHGSTQNTYASLGSLVALTRTTAKVGIYADGRMKSFGSGVLATSDLGLSVEGAGTNLCTHSEGTTGWSTPANITYTTSAAIGSEGPFGSAGWMTITSSANGAAGQINATIPNDSNEYTVSLFVRKSSGGGTCQLLASLSGGTPPTQSVFQWNNTTGATVVGTGPGATLIDYGSYWRVAINITNNTSGNTVLSALFKPSVSGQAAIDVAGVQVEVNGFMSSYVATSGSTATRNADVVSRALAVTTTGALVPGDFNPAQGGFSIDGISAPGLGSGKQVLYHLSDGTENNVFEIYRDSSGNLTFVVISGGTVQSSRSLGTLANNTPFTASLFWNGTTTEYQYNSLTFLESAVTLPVGVTTAHYGQDTTGNYWYGQLARVAHYTDPLYTLPLFSDSFNRANTTAPSLGTAPNGQVWTIWGPYNGGGPNIPQPTATGGVMLPAVGSYSGSSTNCAIVNKAYQPVNALGTEDDPIAYYAAQFLPQTVRHMGALVQWINPGGTPPGVEGVAMIIGSSAITLNNCIHVTVSTTSFVVDKRINFGSFTNILTVSSLSLRDYNPHYISYRLTGSTLNCYVDGALVGSVTDSDLPGLVGQNVVWEIYSASNPVYPVKILTVDASP